MKVARWIVAIVTMAGVLLIGATAEARVRDPISRKFLPEKGFFEPSRTQVKNPAQVLQPRPQGGWWLFQKSPWQLRGK